uniref:Uncharacterized protein n=1 Tax=Salix viminalis TaxID=40686 RepID=A0A6N2M6E0_SALVM
MVEKYRPESRGDATENLSDILTCRSERKRIGGPHSSPLTYTCSCPSLHRDSSFFILFPSQIKVDLERQRNRKSSFVSGLANQVPPSGGLYGMLLLN